MRSGVKNSNEEEEGGFGEEEQGPNQTSRDGKGINSKTTTTRSKHSVTEQRRRSKINERFQRLRGLIPNSDQKRDTASFLLEVIDYVQYLQGEVQKYEGPYQPWGSEPTKLMPWRNSHLRTQSIAPQPMGNGVGAGYKFSDASQSLLIGHPHEFGEPDTLTDPTGKTMGQQHDLASSAMPMPMQEFSHPIQNDDLVSHQPLSDSQAVDHALTPGTVSPHDGLVIEEGTISVSSAYSHGLLHTLTDALQSAGVDLSQANISVQINLGKRANRGPAAVEEYHNLPCVTHPQPSGSSRDSEQAQKRLKTQN